MDARDTPSENTKSPTENGAVAVVNPFTGVERTQVTTPAWEEKMLLIPTPLLLLTEKILDSTSEMPFGDSTISTEEMDEPWTFAITSPVS